MAELAAEAGCAVGTLYGRIQGKDVLLQSLLDLYGDRHSAVVEHVLRGPEKDLPSRSRRLVDAYLAFYARHPGLVRTVAMHLYRGEPGLGAFRRRSTTEFRRSAAWLQSAAGVRHEEPAAAAQLGFLAALTLAQNRLAIGERSGVRRAFPLAELRRELVRLLVSYLGSRPAATDRPLPGVR